MINRMRKTTGSAFIEYIALILIMIAAFLVMENYVKRGLGGRWRSSGDLFGAGRQYQPNVTVITRE